MEPEHKPEQPATQAGSNQGGTPPAVKPGMPEGFAPNPTGVSPTAPGGESASMADAASADATARTVDAGDVPVSASTAPAGPATAVAPVAADAPSVPSPITPTAPIADATAPVVPGQAAAPIPHPKKNKKLLVLGAIIAILVIILLGAGAAAYYVVLNKPQNVLNMALANFASADKTKSAAFEGTVAIAPKGSGAMEATFSGASSSDGPFTVSGSFDAMLTKVTFDARSVDGKSYYLRVGGLDGLAPLLGASGDTASLYAPIISSINNQWIEINQSMLQQLTGDSSSVNTKLSAQDREKLKDAYKQHQFLQVSKTLKDETIHGKASHHYQVTVDKIELKNFAAAVKNANISSMKLDAEALKTFNAEVDKLNFAKYPVDVWISKADKMLDQIGFSTSASDGKVELRVAMTGYNQPVSVSKPAGAKSLLELISGLLTGAGLGASGSTLQDLGSGISL